MSSVAASGADWEALGPAVESVDLLHSVGVLEELGSSLEEIDPFVGSEMAVASAPLLTELSAASFFMTPSSEGLLLDKAAAFEFPDSVWLPELIFGSDLRVKLDHQISLFIGHTPAKIRGQ